MIKQIIINNLFIIKRFIIVIHLGKNPNIGGKPPKDNNGKQKIIFLKLLLEILNDNIWLIL